MLVIMAGTVMLAYYFEYTDTFNVHVQGFFCYDNAYVKPYHGPEESSSIPPTLLYALVAGVPTLVEFLIRELDDADNREVVRLMVQRKPGLVFDVLEIYRRRHCEPPPAHVPGGNLGNYREMPTDRERKC
uniref:Uncharacterized protein n=1 Tax=Hucho hucho TaxID=62062 RepID=A0A4W5RLY6_9TELE